MEIAFFELPQNRLALLPLTFTKPIALLRVGITTLAEKWSFFLEECSYTFQTEEYLKGLFKQPSKSTEVFVNGAVVATFELAQQISVLKKGQALYSKNILIAYHTEAKDRIDVKEDVLTINKPSDIFTYNGRIIRSDFNFIRHNRVSASINDAYTMVYGVENIFIEEGVSIKAAILNASEGPIYLGKGVEIQEGAIIKGPFVANEGAVIAMGAKMRGDNTVGPYCKVGGEVSNSVFQGFSNKVHDGFIGNSVIGEWCNIAAGTNCSNLKNNYSEVKVYDYSTQKEEPSGLIFHGLIMGDFARCGINSMLNTGTVLGVSCNLYDGSFPPKFVPSFSWGTANAREDFELNKAIEVATRAMERRKVNFTSAHKTMFHAIFNLEKEARLLSNQ